MSDTTIYKDAVMDEISEPTKILVVDSEVTFNLKQSHANVESERRGSTSSEDQIDTSDEIMDVDNFIADCEARALNSKGGVVRESEDKTYQYKGDDMIREAEAAKVRMAATPGEFQSNHCNVLVSFCRQQAVIVDKNYIMVGSHVDENLRNKIVQHEYVDFARLLPRDRLACEDDHRMELCAERRFNILCSCL